MNNLLSLQYWFNSSAGSLALNIQKYFIIFIVILAILAFFIIIIKSRYQRSLYFKIWRRLQVFFITNLVISLFLLFFTYESVPFLSMRFWFLLWGIGVLVWLVFIGKDLSKIPNIKEEIAKEKEYRKYIP